MKPLFPAITILAVCAVSFTFGQPPEGKQAIDALMTAQEKGQVLFGHQDSYFYGHSWENIIASEDVLYYSSDILLTCDDYPAILGCDLGDLETGSERNLDKVPFQSIRKAIIRQHSLGGLSSISWHCDNPTTGGDAWDISCDTVVRSILPGHPNNAKFRSWLDSVSDFLCSLKDDDGSQIPVIFRPYHEHTGSWFWWGQDLCTDEEYIALWRYSYDYLTSKCPDCIIWAYSPAAGKPGYMDRYPGDRYVDILGLDAYHYGGIGGAANFIASTNAELKTISKIASEHGKLAALTETGSESIPDPHWWTGTLLKALEGTSVCYVLVWRNAFDRPGHFYAPYPGHTSAENFKEFYKLPQTIFIKDLNL